LTVSALYPRSTSRLYKLRSTVARSSTLRRSNLSRNPKRLGQRRRRSRKMTVRKKTSLLRIHPSRSARARRPPMPSLSRMTVLNLSRKPERQGQRKGRSRKMTVRKNTSRLRTPRSPSARARRSLRPNLSRTRTPNLNTYPRRRGAGARL
jgi:hypothetical protein